jgi:hypothetical protein
MKLVVSKSEENIKESGGGNGAYINRSAIYDVNLNYVQVAETKNGAQQLNFNVTNQGMEQTIYGPIIQQIDGKVNDITYGLLNRLCIIAGMDESQGINTETTEYPVGREQKLMEMEVIPELSDIPVKIRIQMEYNLYNNKIQERKVVRAFYREDGATAKEATANNNIGRVLEMDAEKYADNITYNDGLTPEDVAEWVKERVAANSAGKSAPAPTAKATAKRPLFNKEA